MTDAQDEAARKRVAEYQQPLSLEARKLAMWDELLFALETVVLDFEESRKFSFEYWKDKQDVIDHARALGEK
jgi:hypothetical protein